MSLRNTRREQQRRQREYHERYGIKLTSVALRPHLHVPLTYLKDTHRVTLSDVIQGGLNVYRAMKYFDGAPTDVVSNLDIKNIANISSQVTEQSDQQSWDEEDE